MNIDDDFLLLKYKKGLLKNQWEQVSINCVKDCRFRVVSSTIPLKKYNYEGKSKFLWSFETSNKRRKWVEGEE